MAVLMAVSDAIGRRGTSSSELFESSVGEVIRGFERGADFTFAFLLGLGLALAFVFGGG